MVNLLGERLSLSWLPPLVNKPIYDHSSTLFFLTTQLSRSFGNNRPSDRPHQPVSTCTNSLAEIVEIFTHRKCLTRRTLPLAIKPCLGLSLNSSSRPAPKHHPNSNVSSNDKITIEIIYGSKEVALELIPAIKDKEKRILLMQCCTAL